MNDGDDGVPALRFRIWGFGFRICGVNVTCECDKEEFNDDDDDDAPAFRFGISGLGFGI